MDYAIFTLPFDAYVYVFSPSDLRWNSIGLLGGRAILEMLKTNKSICRLELAGNNIPGDIVKSIGKNISRILF